MMRKSILKFVSSSQVHIFDLNYTPADKLDKHSKTCHIKVGSHRELDVHVADGQLYMDYLATENGKLVALLRQPVALQQDDNGKACFDVCQFLQERGHTPTFCTETTYTRWKNRPDHSDTLMITPYGGARALRDHSTGLYHVDLYFTSNMLHIDGQHTRSISWKTYSIANSAENEVMQSLIRTLLTKPHHLTAKEATRHLKQMNLEGIDNLCIQTDTGVCWLRNDVAYSSFICREQQHPERFYPCTLSATAFAETGLKLLTCANVKRTVTRMSNQGLLERTAA